EVAALIAGNERLEVLAVWGNSGEEVSGALGGSSSSSSSTGGSSSSSGILQFTTRGSVLHGINAEELNAELLRRANASGLLLLAGVTSPGHVSAVTNTQSRDRVVSLLLPLASRREEARQQAAALLAAADPLLRRAYAHVHNCKCDVAGAVQALVRG
ncbi:hypothetical protein Agub_g1715, partial [Astrephomene gubernaculifera]